jgi:hypothetical protein
MSMTNIFGRGSVDVNRRIVKDLDEKCVEI